jgi:pimeloyl-ACP methyl ester carboxylesterase
MPFAELSEVRLEYFEHGSGPEVVVMVHGFQSSGRIWHATQRALPAHRYRSIAINNRGAGDSGAPPAESDFTVQKFAADLHELVEGLALPRFTLVGHSMGGATVAQYAVEHPDRIAGLVLLDPASPNGGPLEGSALERFLDQRLAARDSQLARNREDEILDGAVGAHDPEQIRQLLADIRNAQLRLAERVRSLPMPVLLAAGDRDAVIPLPDMLASWAMYPPGSGLHVWHGVGHSPNLDCPRELAALLERFIEGPVSAARGKAAAAPTRSGSAASGGTA